MPGMIVYLRHQWVSQIRSRELAGMVSNVNDDIDGCRDAVQGAGGRGSPCQRQSVSKQLRPPSPHKLSKPFPPRLPLDLCFLNVVDLFEHFLQWMTVKRGA